MKNNESQNTKIAEQILVKRSSITFGLVFKIPLHMSCAAFLGDASTLSGIHFFIDQFLTDCQSKEAKGGDCVEHGEILYRKCKCEIDLNMNSMKSCKEVKT